MGRRAFIGTFAYSIFPAPLVAEAQPPGRIYRVGVLAYFSASQRVA
jgi:hypothetical protein